MNAIWRKLWEHSMCVSPMTDGAEGFASFLCEIKLDSKIYVYYLRIWVLGGRGRREAIHNDHKRSATCNCAPGIYAARRSWISRANTVSKNEKRKTKKKVKKKESSVPVVADWLKHDVFIIRACVCVCVCVYVMAFVSKGEEKRGGQNLFLAATRAGVAVRLFLWLQSHWQWAGAGNRLSASLFIVRTTTNEWAGQHSVKSSSKVTRTKSFHCKFIFNNLNY